MAPEPRNDTLDTSHLLWNNWTESPKETHVTSLNTTELTDKFLDSAYIRYVVILSVTVLVCLCGMAGNGTVVWLLGFRVRRNPYSVYILNLAVADFTYLLAVVLQIIDILAKVSRYLMWFGGILALSSYSVSPSLLMAISSERCVSVLWPIWYKCRRPAQLSKVVCAVTWVLFYSYVLATSLYSYLANVDRYVTWRFCNALSLLTLPVLFVTGLALVIWGRCCARQRQRGKLYTTILLNVLAVLLLNVPRGVHIALSWSTSPPRDPWSVIILLCAVNSSVNPVIYFFVGRHGKQPGRKPLREVLQSALTDEEAGTEQRRGITVPGQHTATPEHQGGRPCRVSMSDPEGQDRPWGKSSEIPRKHPELLCDL